jgi:hypothetical protein
MRHTLPETKLASMSAESRKVEKMPPSLFTLHTHLGPTGKLLERSERDRPHLLPDVWVTKWVTDA